jgi:hypothetical protein
MECHPGLGNGLRRLQGPDLNQRPLGYEPFPNPLRDHQIASRFSMTTRGSIPLGARLVAHPEDPAKLSRRATSSSRPHVEAVLLLATIAQLALDSEGRQQFHVADRS